MKLAAPSNRWFYLCVNLIFLILILSHYPFLNNKNNLERASGILILMNWAVFWTSWRITKLFYSHFNILQKFIALIIFALAQVILTETLLGICSMLTLQNIFFIAFFIWLIFGIIYYLIKKPDQINEQNSLISLRENKENLPVLFLSIFVIWVISQVLKENLIKLPVFYDVLSYHLPFPITWMKYQDLRMMRYSYGDIAQTYYPINQQLISLWMMIPFGNTTFPTKFIQLPFFIIALLIIYQIGKRFNLSDYALISVISLIAISPVFLKREIIEPCNDIAVAGMMLTTLFAILTYLEDRRIRNLIFLSFCWGIFVGIKYTAIFFSLPLFLFMAYLWIVHEKNTIPKGRFHILKIPGKITLALFIIFVFGGFCYCRNFIITGSFIYPAGLKIAGIIIFPGLYYPQEINYKQYEIHQFHLYDFLFKTQYDLLGIAFPLFFIPYYFLGLIGDSSKKERNLFKTCLNLLPLILFLIFLSFFRDLREMRYIYSAYFLMALPIATVIDKIKSVRKASFFLVLFCLLWTTYHHYQFVNIGESILLSGILAVGLHFIYGKIKKTSRYKWAAKWGAFAILMIFSILAYKRLPALIREYNKQDLFEYPQKEALKAGWAFIENNYPQTQNILNFGNNIPLPLYGCDLRHRVFDFDLALDEESIFYDLPKSWKNFKIFDSKRWQEYANYQRYTLGQDKLFQLLNQYFIDLIFIFNPKEPIKIEGEISNLFQEVYHNGEVQILEVKNKIRR